MFIPSYVTHTERYYSHHRILHIVSVTLVIKYNCRLHNVICTYIVTDTRTILYYIIFVLLSRIDRKPTFSFSIRRPAFHVLCMMLYVIILNVLRQESKWWGPFLVQNWMVMTDLGYLFYALDIYNQYIILEFWNNNTIHFIVFCIWQNLKVF